jgi:hypothetical protein
MDPVLQGIATDAVMTARSESRFIFMAANTAFCALAHSKIQNSVSTKRCSNALFATKPSGLCDRSRHLKHEFGTQCGVIAGSAMIRKPPQHTQSAQGSGSTELAEVLGEVGSCCTPV